MKKILNNKLIIIIGVSLFIIILLLLFLLVFNKKNIEVIDNSTTIMVGGYKQTIIVKTLDEVKVTEGKYAGKYARIFLEVENMKEFDSVTSLHQFFIVDKNNSVISNCYHDSLLPDNNFDNIFPSTIQALNITSGYLYCPIKKSNMDKLKITVISGGKIEENNEITYEYEDYYIDLKK